MAGVTAGVMYSALRHAYCRYTLEPSGGHPEMRTT
nr:MAG TPA: hypothetical protein [Caudoviricetes sp.]